MLLNHFKQRSLRGSQQDVTFQQDSTFPALKESTMENIPGPVDDGKVTQDRKNRKSNKLITTLLNSKRAMAATFNNANNQSPTALQENNPFKKRVEQYFKQCDNVSLQQKLRTLAPTTINNLTMTTNRNNPITNKPFLVAPFEKNSQIEKRFTPMESQRASVNLKNYGQNRMASADGRRNSMLSTQEDNTQAQESTLVSNVTKIIRGPRAKSNETATDRLEKKLASLRIPSYTSIDKESVDGNTEKTKRKSESVKHKRRTPTGEQTRTRRRDSMDSDSCLNFRTASTLRHRYLQTTEEDITQKEGSLLRYFRAKVVKQRPATTHKAAQRSSIKAQDVVTQQVPQSPPRAKTAAPRRSRDITMVNQSQGEEDNEKGIGSADTSFEGFSVLDSFNISDTLQVSRPTTAMEKGLKNGEVKRNTAGNTTLFSSMMNKDSMDVVLVPDEDHHLSYSDDKEEIMNSSIADGFTLGDRQETFAAKVKVPDQIRKNHDFLIQIKESRRYQNNSLEYSSAQDSAKGSVTSKREPITERLTEENEPNFPESDKKVGKSGWTNPGSSLNNLQELVDYARQRGEQLGVEEAQDRTSRLTAKFNQALAMADFVQLKGGVVQRALRSSVDSAIPTVFRKDVKEMKDAQENIENLTEKIQTFRETKEKFHQQHKQKLEQAKIASVQRLTNTELNTLHEEFLRDDKHDIDVERIDVFLKRLKFFSQLTPDVRSNFYKNALYIHHKIGEYIFHQGDEGDLMYVILKGSVHVKILKKMKDGQSQMVNVNSLYDGTHFGELAIMGVKPKPQQQQPVAEQSPEKTSPERGSPIQKRFIEIDKMISARTASPTKTPTGASAPKAKRSASIQCSEETELLAINREKFQEILFSVMHKDLDAKVRILHQIPFFKNEDSFNLMPIANLLQIRHYKLGQRIIKAGDALTNFYLVADGRCKVVSEVTDGYPLDVEIYKDRLKPFKFKPGKIRRAEEPQATDGFRRTRELSNPMRRTFDNEPFLKHSERRASTGKPDKFTKHVFFGELIPGSCFGFRPLLKTDEENRYMSNRENHAKLSVVAESPNVEIYVLPRASVMLIPERVKNLLLDGVAKMSDFDDCDINKPVQEHQTWRKYQLNVLQNALTKSEHPHLRRFRDSYKAK